VAYDVKRLNSIRQGEADISDRDAVVEIVAGTVETMVTAHRKTSAALENRYRNQLRALHEVMQRLNVEADLPASLRTWAATQPANVPSWMIRESAEDIFDHLLDGINENQDGAIDVPNSVSMATSDRESEAVIGPQHRMLEVMYETFALTGQWPLFQYVNAQLWEELQVEPRDGYLDLAERSLVNPAITRSHHFELRENIPVGVSLHGMTYLPAATEDLSHFVSIIRYVAERAVRFRPSSATELERLSVTSEEIRLHVGLATSDAALRRLGTLVSTEAWQLWTSFTGPNHDAWSCEVNLERARRYRDVHTVIEFLALSYPKGQQQSPSLPASPTSLGSIHAVTPTNNRKVMVVHGRDKARQDLFNFLRALGLEPIEWSAAVKSTGTTKPYTGQAVEAAFHIAQAALILLVPEEQVALHIDLRDPEDPSDAQLAWQPRPNVFYEGGIAVTSHPHRTIVLELGRPRTATDLAGVNTIRIGSDQGWRHDLANRLRDAGCPVNTEGTDWLTVGTFTEPNLYAESPSLTPPSSGESPPSSYADDEHLIEIPAATGRAGSSRAREEERLASESLLQRLLRRIRAPGHR
jgi:predicted nucleotide-binding protein